MKSAYAKQAPPTNSTTSYFLISQSNSYFALFLHRHAIPFKKCIVKSHVTLCSIVLVQIEARGLQGHFFSHNPQSPALGWQNMTNLSYKFEDLWKLHPPQQVFKTTLGWRWCDVTACYLLAISMLFTVGFSSPRPLFKSGFQFLFFYIFLCKF